MAPAPLLAARPPAFLTPLRRIALPLLLALAAGSVHAQSTVVTSTLSYSLSASDTAGSYYFFGGECKTMAGSKRYRTTTMRVAVAGSYQFDDAIAQGSTLEDAMLGAYAGSFDPATPGNCYFSVDDGISTTLTPGTYTLVLTSWWGSPVLPANFQYTITGPGALLFSPEQPAAPNATAGNAQATVSWVAPADGGSAITGFTVVAVEDPSKTCSGAVSATQCTVTGLTNGTAYTFTVTASNAIGANTSAPSSPVTPQATKPDQPAAPDATAGNTQATVTWVAPADGGSAITGFTVVAVEDPSKTCSGTASATQCTVTGLVNGTAYTFTVTASNAIGASTPSAPSNAVTPQFDPLLIAPPVSVPPATVGQPYSLQLLATGGAAPYSWAATGLPAGLSIKPATGEISGTPTDVKAATQAKAALSVSITVTDSLGTQAAQTLSLTVNAAPSTTVTAVPTLSELALMALAALAALLGGLRLRRRHAAPQPFVDTLI